MTLLSTHPARPRIFCNARKPRYSASRPSAFRAPASPWAAAIAFWAASPLLSPAAADPRLYLATGHEGLGITTSLATGRLIADRIVGRTPAIPAEPYLPSRKQEAH